MFKVFIYGTLKSTGDAHHLLAGKFDEMKPAKLTGKLYLREEDGIPYITVPGRFILGRGSRDYGRDNTLLTKLEVPSDYSPHEEATFVHGELYFISDYQKLMEILDLFEDFSPGHESEYDRVLYPVSVDNGESYSLSWIYTIANNSAEKTDELVLEGLYFPKDDEI